MQKEWGEGVEIRAQVSPHIFLLNHTAARRTRPTHSARCRPTAEDAGHQLHLSTSGSVLLRQPATSATPQLPIHITPTVNNIAAASNLWVQPSFRVSPVVALLHPNDPHIPENINQ